MNIISRTLVSGLLFAFAAQPRCVVLLRDVSASSRTQLPAASERMKAVTQMLGPTDSLTLVDVGPHFQPGVNVRIQCDMPTVPPAILKPVRNIRRADENQRALDSIWDEVDSNIKEIEAFLDTPVAGSASPVTDLFGALEYVSLRLKREPCDEVYIFLYTDLEHDYGGISSDRPPSARLPFNNSRIEAFFVPWRNANSWQKQESAWRDWFVSENHAGRFAMLPVADSLRRQPLSSSRIPRQVPSPLSINQSDTSR